MKAWKINLSLLCRQTCFPPHPFLPFALRSKLYKPSQFSLIGVHSELTRNRIDSCQHSIPWVNNLVCYLGFFLGNSKVLLPAPTAEEDQWTPSLPHCRPGPKIPHLLDLSCSLLSSSLDFLEVTFATASAGRSCSMGRVHQASLPYCSTILITFSMLLLRKKAHQ